MYHIEWYLYQELKDRRKRLEKSEEKKKIIKKHRTLSIIYAAIMIPVVIISFFLFKKSDWYWLIEFAILLPFLVIGYFIGDFKRSKDLHLHGFTDTKLLKSILDEMGINTPEQMEYVKQLCRQRAKAVKFSKAVFKGFLSFLVIVNGFLQFMIRLLPKKPMIEPKLIFDISFIGIYAITTVFFIVKPWIEDFLNIDFNRLDHLLKTLEDVDLIYYHKRSDLGLPELGAQSGAELTS